MIVYLDTSVLLAELFSEDGSPPMALWSRRLVASRLLEHEVFNRVHARGAFSTHGDAARRLVDRVDLVEMSSSVLGRALLPFPKPVRALDALHLATLDFLRGQGLDLGIATYGQRLAVAAVGLGFPLADC